MRGTKKNHTKLLLDRNRVLSFYITPRQQEVYEQDEFKYLIHLLKIFPSDEFRITQYLLLRFHPLIINTCRKFYAKNINLDWLDLISFARYSFVELVLRFNLDSTLYFKTYIPLALDRAINDFLLYDIRRKSLRAAIRLDTLHFQDRDYLIQEHCIVVNKDNKETENHSQVEEYRVECIQYIKNHKAFTAVDKAVFLDNFIKNKALVQICNDRHLNVDVMQPRIQDMLDDVKEHIRLNFL